MLLPNQPLAKQQEGANEKKWRLGRYRHLNNRETFLKHYHQRSNVETAFSMMKAKFGGSVRAKTPTAQVNEALLKVLCHNICCLIMSWYEFGIEAQFDQAAPALIAAAPKPAPLFQNLVH